MMLPVGRLTMVRTFAKSELIRAMSFVAIPGLVGPMLGPLIGGAIIGYFHWSVIFFVNIPIGLCGLYMVYRHLPNYREQRNYPLDIIGLVLFGSGIALPSYVLEVFGETTLSPREMLGLLAISRGTPRCLWPAHGTAVTVHPLLRLRLLRIRSFRVAVSGNLFTRLGMLGGIPFLLPLLYQVGLGFTPDSIRIAHHALQALAAMSLKLTIPLILKRFGFTAIVLIANTVALGLMINAVRETIGSATPVWPHRPDGVHLWFPHIAAVHQHEIRWRMPTSMSGRPPAPAPSPAPSSKWPSASAWPYLHLARCRLIHPQSFAR